MKIRRLLFIICVALCSCGNHSNSASDDIKGRKLDMKFASLLQMTECDGYVVADIKNPWGNNILHRYILVDKDSAMPATMPSGTLLRTPLNNVLLFATMHAELLGCLGVSHAVGGVCEPEYMTQQYIREGLENNTITDCGTSLNIDLERVVELSPSAVFVLPYENGGYGKLDKLTYPLVECVEYMETSPLASAEWMRFYGRLLGCAAKADSLFDEVCHSYLSLRDSVAAVSPRPKLMCELKSSSAWYVPGGRSTMGVLYNDAGAHYLFSDNNGMGALPLAFETVLEKASSADIWLIKYGADTDKTRSSLLAEFEGYKYFKPFANGNIYACNLSKKRFYEETPFRPDLLLRELVALFHPDFYPDIKPLRYYEKMAQ